MKQLALLISIGLCATSYPLELPKKITKTMLNALCYIIASSDASEETEVQAKNLLNEVAPDQELSGIRTFNWFGKFLFGQNNTITIPYLNYIIVDDSGMKKLSEKARQFALGRCMLTLKNSHQYMTYKYLIPLALQQLSKTIISPKDQKTLDNFYKKCWSLCWKGCRSSWGMLDIKDNEVTQNEYDGIVNHYQQFYLPDRAQQEAQRELSEDDLIIHSCTDKEEPCFTCSWPNFSVPSSVYKTIATKELLNLPSNYSSRYIEYKLDAETATTFDCKDGAEEYLKSLHAHGWGHVISHYLYCIGGAKAGNNALELDKTIKDNPNIVHSATSSVLKEIYWLVYTTTKAIQHAPGQNSSTYKLGGLFSLLPGVGRLFTSFPTADCRLEALDNLSDQTSGQEQGHLASETAI